jgi:fluoride ion exporter CrcB/FEX
MKMAIISAVRLSKERSAAHLLGPFGSVCITHQRYCILLEQERWSPLNVAPATNDSYSRNAVGACHPALSDSPKKSGKKRTRMEQVSLVAALWLVLALLAMQSRLKARTSRLVWNSFTRIFNLRWRRGFGSLHHGNARRSNRVSDTIRVWHGYYEQAWSTIPVGTLVINVTGSFLIGLLMTRSPSGFSPTPTGGCCSWLASSAATRRSPVSSGRDAQPREGRWTLARLVQTIGNVLLGYAAVWLGSIMAAKR